MVGFPLCDGGAAGAETQAMSGGVGQPGADSGVVSLRGLLDGVIEIGGQRDRPFVSLSHSGMVAQAVGQLEKDRGSMLSLDGKLQRRHDQPLGMGRPLQDVDPDRARFGRARAYVWIQMSDEQRGIIPNLTTSGLDRREQSDKADLHGVLAKLV